MFTQTFPGCQGLHPVWLIHQNEWSFQVEMQWMVAGLYPVFLIPTDDRWRCRSAKSMCKRWWGGFRPQGLTGTTYLSLWLLSVLAVVETATGMYKSYIIHQLGFFDSIDLFLDLAIQYVLCSISLLQCCSCMQM